jgi:hypothetical protein
MRRWINEDDEVQKSSILSTLNPEYIQHTDYLDISNLRHPSARFTGRRACTFRFFKINDVIQPFPPNTCGFLYFHCPRDEPPLTYGIRFRITQSSRPTSFASGTDLFRSPSIPWQIPLSTLAAATGRAEALRAQLLEEGLITEEQLNESRTAIPNKKRLNPTLTLHQLSQSFPVFFNRGIWLQIVGADNTALWNYPYMFADMRAKFRPHVHPYSGTSAVDRGLAQC